MNKDKYIKNLLIGLLFLLIILVYSKVHFVFKPVLDLLKIFLGPLIIGGFIYYWLRPITRKLSIISKEKFKGVFSIIALILFFTLLIIIISLSGVVLKEQLSDTYKTLDSADNYIELANTKLKALNLDKLDFSKITSFAKKYVNQLGKNLPKFFSGLGDFTTQIVLVPFISFYLLKEEDKIRPNLLKISNSEYKGRVDNLISKLDTTLSDYIVGQLLVALIIGFLMFIGYLLLKLPNAFLMASFSVITSVIPMIGAFLGILPALLLALTIDIKLVVKIIILSIVVQQLEGDLITPNLMGSKLNIHPFVIMVVVIVSINLLGLLGAFIGIPLYLSISIIIKELLDIRREKISKENK